MRTIGLNVLKNKELLELVVKTVDLWVPEGFAVKVEADFLLGDYWQQSVRVVLHGRPLRELAPRKLQSKFLIMKDGLWKPSEEERTIDTFLMGLYCGVTRTLMRMEYAMKCKTFMVEDSITMNMLKEVRSALLELGCDGARLNCCEVHE